MKKRSFGYSGVIITGGSSGIGACFLDSIINLDQNVLICNLSRQKPIRDIPGDRFYHFPCDLSKAENIEAVFPQVCAMLKDKGAEGPLLLINNSGFGSYGEFQESDLSGQLDMIEVNICAVVRLTGLFLPLMLEREGSGVINIASTAAFQPTPYMATYGATKSFLLNWTLAVGEDLKGRGVQMLAVCPGPTESNFFKIAGSDLGSKHRQSAEEVVELTWKALRTGKPFVVTGLLNKLISCLVRFMPLSLTTRVSGIILRRVRVSNKSIK